MSDLRGFSSICERLSPEQVVTILNTYLGAMADVIDRHRGSINEFLGDAILALFGAPVASDDHPERAVACALEMQLAMDDVNATLRAQGLPAIEMGVGVHTGECVVGNIGSDRRAKYGVVGTPINPASRIEGLNKALGTSILLSDAVHAQIGDEFCTRRVGQFKIKGRVDTTTVYELLGPASITELPEWARCYEAALTAFESGDRTRAKELFEQTNRLRLAAQGDGPSKFFLEHLAKNESSVAGVVELREKWRGH